ncbi:TBC1 domain family member 15-like, partial [Plectropomus leopardus]|uniref:TBC1 domain family member 15-like n=1 Tax=Plectropomus leopardus TaxID=160734 RepID=UPI001C4D5EBF
EVIPGLEINQQEEPGFEVITRIDLGTRPQVTRREPLSVEDWSRHQDPEGRMVNVPLLKHSIFKGGLCHAVRKEAWKFLLGYVPWDSTLEDRKVLQRAKTDEYFRMKLQWKSVSAEQERRNSRLREYRSLIEKDVNRTDRTNRFYEGMDNPGLVLLHDILMTYCMFDFDLGYVQGMSDLLSPILYVMENEVDAFWCFVSFMDQMVSSLYYQRTTDRELQTEPQTGPQTENHRQRTTNKTTNREPQTENHKQDHRQRTTNRTTDREPQT